jgi:hypothetical protein
MRRLVFLTFLIILLTGCYSLSSPKPTASQTPKPTATISPTPRLFATLVSFDYYPKLNAFQKGCSTPAGCAQLLINEGWIYDSEQEAAAYGNNVIPSPVVSLQKMVGRCATIAYAVAAGVLDNGYPPNILVVVASDVSHAIYLYQDTQGLWGYVQVLQLAPMYRPHLLVVDNQEPRFATINQLFTYYVTEGTHSADFYKYYFYTKKDLPENWLTTSGTINPLSYTEKGP